MLNRFAVFASTIVLVVAGALPAAAQKQSPPAPAPPKPFTVPPKQTFSLANGMRVTLVPYGRVPKLNAALIVRAGNLNEGAEQVWLADITGEMLKEGTKTRSAAALAGEFADMGGQLAVQVGPDQTRLSTEVLSEFGPRAVQLLADVVQNPLLPESELPRLKNDAQRRLAVEKSTPQSLGLERFRQVLYPGHPYGRIYPTEAMIQKYGLADVRKFYSENFGAARTHLIVAGQFDARALRRAIEQAFGKWQPGPAPLLNPPKPHKGRMLEVLDRPGAHQSTLYVGLPVVYPGSPDYVPMVVLNALLGGSFGSRITSNIREQKGYTYSPFSQISARYHDAYWAEVADVTTAVTGPSLKEIFYEIERLRTEAPPDKELAGIQKYLSGIFVLQNSSRAGLINQLNFVDLHGLGDDYLRTYVQKVNAVTPQQVQELARKYLESDQMVIVVVGDQEKIAEQVAPYKQAAMK